MFLLLCLLRFKCWPNRKKKKKKKRASGPLSIPYTSLQLRVKFQSPSGWHTCMAYCKRTSRSSPTVASPDRLRYVSKSCLCTITSKHAYQLILVREWCAAKHTARYVHLQSLPHQLLFCPADLGFSMHSKPSNVKSTTRNFEKFLAVSSALLKH